MKQEKLVLCAASGCTREISADALARTRYCVPHQLRERELRAQLAGIELDEADINTLWDGEDTFPMSVVRRLLGIKERTCYAAAARGTIKASVDSNGRMVVSREDLIRAIRIVRGVLPLTEAAERLGIDYHYLRDLVRRRVVVPDTTFFGRYGISVLRLAEVKERTSRTLPGDGEVDLSTAARLMGVHHSAIQRMIRAGRIKASKGVTGRVIIALPEIQSYLRSSGDGMDAHAHSSRAGAVG